MDKFVRSWLAELKSYAAIFALVAVLACVPIVAQLLDNPFLIRLLTRAVLLGMAAVGLNFILGFGGLLSLMHASLFGIGAYVVAILAWHDFNMEPVLGFSGTSNVLIALPVALLCVGLAAMTTGVIALRTMGAYFIMITLAFNQMLYYFSISLQTYGGGDGLQILSTLTFNHFVITSRAQFYWLCVAVLGTVLIVMHKIIKSRFGMILQACAQNERRVKALGFAPLPYKLVAFVISGLIAGLAGALWAVGQGFVSPADLSWMRSADLVVIAVLGGTGRVYGPVLGAIVFVVLESVLSGLTPYWQLPLGLIVIGIVVFLKGGLADLFVGRRHA